MADIFLSHLWEDRRVAHFVGERFRQHGWRVWLQLTVDPESRSSEEIETQLLTAKCIVVLWSKRSINSIEVKADAAVGITRGVLVQALIDDVAVPDRFREVQAINLINADGDIKINAVRQLERLVEGFTGPRLQTQLDPKHPSPHPLPGAPVGPSSTASRHRIGQEDEPARLRRVFLCYRRQDTQGHTGRLRDRLVNAHGKDAVFMDVDAIPYGVDFVDHIEEVLKSCAVMVVMIGQSWTTILDKKGRRKLDLPDDLVRGEIAAALARKIPVIPVLVEDASMPDAEDVPGDIRGLTRRNAIELTHRRWDSDVQHVLKVIEKFMGKAKPGG